ncbi:ABC transporter substrate-binding protein [Bacillus seohaeanensis]|jgi:iron complex transport system substrate-binding protein|uniref:ABC transporter substrate-binding protein n=1 Tax=Bacillus seohaeanensis TaxID=284580 RepID=A0ABW5RUI0_9BACI
MKKFYSLFLTLLLVLGVLAGCGQSEDGTKDTGTSGEKTEQADGNKESAFPLTITDAVDEEVVIEKQPEKIISLVPSNTEIAYELGLGEKIVGVSDNDNYPEEVTEKEKVGGMEFNVEKVISLSPDLVLAHESGVSYAKEGFKQLREAGIPVFVVKEATNFDETFETIETIGKITGTTKDAEEIVTTMKEDLDAIKEKVASVTEKKKVYVEVSPAPEIFTTGKNTFMDQMLTTINAENAVSDQEGWVQMDQEAVIALNPDVIITTYGFYTENPKQQIMSRDGWQDMKALKEEQIYDVHSDLVTRTGPRLIEGVEEIAKAVYPEVFAE